MLVLRQFCTRWISIHRMTQKNDYERVLVHLSDTDDDACHFPAPFHSSVVDRLRGADASDKNSALVRWRLAGRRMIIVPANINDFSAPTLDRNDFGSAPCLLVRPSFCPITNLSEEQRENLPADVIERGVAPGVAVLVESAGKVLLTRRAKHMRTFPSVWVPPGGHVETGESALDAGMRELYEETGLALSKTSLLSVSCLGLWESTYPPTLSRGQPRRHHIVVYLHLRLDKTPDEAESTMRLDKEEVDAAAWVDQRLAASIVDTSEGVEIFRGKSYFFEDAREAEKIEIIEMSPDSPPIQRKREIATSVFLNVAPDKEGIEVERVSSGTKCALGFWLRSKQRNDKL